MWPKSYHTNGPKSTFLRDLVRHTGPYQNQKHAVICILVNLPLSTKHLRRLSYLSWIMLVFHQLPWNPHTHKNVSILEKIQNRGARWVCGSRFNPKLSNGQNLQLTTAESVSGHHYQRQKYLCLTTLYDILHQLISLSLDNYFTLFSTATRSHSLSLLCKQSSINSFRFSFFVNSIFFWNNIPYSISRCASFRNLLYNYLCSD